MSDPDFVKLAAGITVLSDPTTAWGLSQNSVAAFSSGVGEANFVRRALRFGQLVASTQEEYDAWVSANPDFGPQLEMRTVALTQQAYDALLTVRPDTLYVIYSETPPP